MLAFDNTQLNLYRRPLSPRHVCLSKKNMRPLLDSGAEARPRIVNAALRHCARFGAARACDSMVVDALPALSMRDRERDPGGFARAMGESYANFGFAIVRDHGLDAGAIARALETTKAFFALPEAVKRKYRLEGQAGQRGYIPFGVEAAKNADAVDLKEFWHVGRELPAGHPYRSYMPDNIWPSEIVT